MLLKITVLAFIGLAIAEERYDNFSLLKIVPQNEAQVRVLKELQKTEELKFWKTATKENDYASVVTPPHMLTKLQQILTSQNIDHEVTIEDLQSEIERSHPRRNKRSTTFEGNLFWNGFQTMENIHAWFDRMAGAHPNIVSIFNVGKSHEGRDMTGIKISRRSNRPAFFLEAGMVGADWLSPAVVTYIADQLIRGENPEALQASNDFDWYIYPVSNPDGYNHSQNDDRFWINNRRGNGVDLTKNWNSQWGVSGGSHSSSDNNFIGLGPFSEPETRFLSNFIESIRNNLVGFFSFRQFGQRLLLPFAHTSQPMYNYNDMVIVGRRAMGALAGRYGTQYLVGSSQEVHDGATGCIGDWVKYRFNPPVVATYLLRDTGSSGYIINVNEVQPTCEETFDSILEILRSSATLGVLSR